MSAQFPSAVKTFTTKNSGDVIQPVDVNDLQDEVNAIEDGYLNAKAPLNSSNSTLRALSVTAGSTLGGTLSVAGGSTFAGNIVLGSSVTLSLGGSVGTAGQVLQSGGSSGVAWANAGNLTTYTPTLSTATGITSSLAVISFEISSGTWLANQRIDILAAIVFGSSALNPTLQHLYRVGANKITGPAGSALSGGSTNMLLRFSFLRASTSIYVFVGPSAGNPQNTENGIGQNFLNNQWTQVISGVDFASSNTLAVVVKPSNSSMTYGVVGASVAKF